MNREIKFRGQDRDKKWHFGDLHHYSDGAIGIRDIINKYGFVVDSETVGRFTGFKDIDGNEIFEGDIIQNDDHEEEIYKIIMIGGCWCGLVFGGDIDDDDDTPLLCWLLDMAPFKVIGNIHDNPELLEGGKG